MKKYLKTTSLTALAVLLLSPAAIFGQDEKDKKQEKEKDKDKAVEQIIITKKGDKTDKIVIEIVGDKVTVNGKDISDYKDGDVTVRKNKIRHTDAFVFTPGTGGNWNFDWNDEGGAFGLLSESSNRAMLGVVTETSDAGVKISEVTKESGAEKAGLKAGDIITKVDNQSIKDPDQLTEVIREHKPGDKVTITYKRDSKENKVTAELGKWKGFGTTYNIAPRVRGQLDALSELPKVEQVFPRDHYFDTWSYSGGSQRLGLSVQDTEDGKGVKVLEVDEETNAAKAGIKQGDIITEFAGKTVNSADEVAKLYREKLKDKTVSVIAVKVLRGGKTQNIEVKIPRKLKTADL